MALRTLALGQSHLRGVSVPRASQKKGVTWLRSFSRIHRIVPGWRTVFHRRGRAGESARRIEDTVCRVIIFRLQDV
jgi:hypothetical protein